MTGKPLTVTQKQVTAILKGAAKAGVRLSIIAREGEVEFLIAEEDVSPSPEIRSIRKGPSFDI
jgi:hypothetical protein